MHRPLFVQRRVAVCLWCLTTPIEYRTVAHLFGIGRSTVSEIVHETCRAIVRVLMKQYIKFPSGDEIDDEIGEFSTSWVVPQRFDFVDGCHIPICAPNKQHTA